MTTKIDYEVLKGLDKKCAINYEICASAPHFEKRIFFVIGSNQKQIFVSKFWEEATRSRFIR